MNSSVPCDKPSAAPTATQIDAHTGISSIAQEILDLGAKVWAEIEAKHGRVTPMHHAEIERRIDKVLHEKYPGKKWHPNFAGLIGGYTEMVESQMQCAKQQLDPLDVLSFGTASHTPDPISHIEVNRNGQPAPDVRVRPSRGRREPDA